MTIFIISILIPTLIMAVIYLAKKQGRDAVSKEVQDATIKKQKRILEHLYTAPRYKHDLLKRLRKGKY